MALDATAGTDSPPVAGMDRLVEEAEEAFRRGDFWCARNLARQALRQPAAVRDAALTRRAESVLDATGLDGLVLALGLVGFVVVLAAFLAVV